MSFLIYKSSAGSGKTFTLVKEYLKIALKDDNPLNFSSILALTFTNKAANEMIERILKSLSEISELDLKSGESHMLNELIKELDCTPDVVQDRARKALKKILHNYHHFSVGTIDSFVHRVIRSFAHEMKLNQQFEVELNGSNILKRAVNRVLSKVGVDKPLTSFLEQYITRNIEEKKSWKIEDSLFDFSKRLLFSHEWYFLEKAQALDIKEYSKIFKNVQVAKRQYENKLTLIANEAVEYALDGLEKSHFANRGVFVNFFQKIIKRDYRPEVGVQMLNLLEKEPAKWASTSAKEYKEDVIAKRDRMIEWFHQIMAIRKIEEEQYLVDKLVSDNIFRVALLNEINEEVQKIKKENDLVLISEFNNLVGEITRKEEVPFIYEKLGEKYTHYLFDEFQDTSLLQWQNMFALVENSLSEGGTNMVVGDAKQSIYRWRGGEVDQFTKLPEVYNPYKDEILEIKKEALKGDVSAPVLSKNYRSKENIVRFNNAFFTFCSEVNGVAVGDAYNEIIQEVREEGSGGYVEFSFPRGNAEEVAETMRETVLNHISSCLEDGYDFRDIAVLTRSKKDTPQLVEFLLRNDIEVISSESLLISKSHAVKLCVALLNHMVKPKESFYYHEIFVLINALYPFQEIHELLSRTKKMTLNQFYVELGVLGYPMDVRKLRILSIYELVSSIVEIFKLEGVKDNRLIAWLDFVFQNSSKSGFGVYDLLEEWENRIDDLSIQLPESLNAVQVMTVHKAKGLDWPVVIFAQGNWADPNTNQIWLEFTDQKPLPVILTDTSSYIEETRFSDELALEKNKIIVDNLNVMYVAYTRPQDRLYVIAKNPEQKIFKEYLPFFELGSLKGELQYKSEISDKGVDEYSFVKFGKALPTNRKLKSSSEGVVEIKNQFNHAYERQLKVKKNYIKKLADDGMADYGNLVHSIFSKIDSKEDIDQAIKYFLHLGDMQKDEVEPIKQTILNVVKSPLVEKYFDGSWKVKNENEIILPNGDLLRPDRVMIKDDYCVVIDFKTGMRKPSHDQQILGYKNELLNLGYSTVEALLIYTTDLQVVAL